jgi:hypothetical protein
VVNALRGTLGPCARRERRADCGRGRPGCSPPKVQTRDDLAAFTPGSLIVDVSCDEGMGFSWARPTSFARPMVTVGDNVGYYAVDHSPSYLWNSATWEISEALLPYLRAVLGGPIAWEADETLRRSIEIQDGIIQNPSILSYQHRSPAYPHPARGGPADGLDQLPGDVAGRGPPAGPAAPW